MYVHTYKNYKRVKQNLKKAIKDKWLNKYNKVRENIHKFYKVHDLRNVYRNLKILIPTTHNNKMSIQK